MSTTAGLWAIISTFYLVIDWLHVSHTIPLNRCKRKCENIAWSRLTNQVWALKTGSGIQKINVGGRFDFHFRAPLIGNHRHSRPIREELYTQSSKLDLALPRPILTIARTIISLIGLDDIICVWLPILIIATKGMYNIIILLPLWMSYYNHKCIRDHCWLTFAILAPQDTLSWWQQHQLLSVLAPQQWAPPTHTWCRLSGRGALGLHCFQNPKLDLIFAYCNNSILFQRHFLAIAQSQHLYTIILYTATSQCYADLLHLSWLNLGLHVEFSLHLCPCSEKAPIIILLSVKHKHHPMKGHNSMPTIKV